MSHSIYIFKRKGGVKYRGDTIACSCVANPVEVNLRAQKAMSLYTFISSNYQPVCAQNVGQLA